MLSCDIDERAALYREVGPILQADQPYVWLLGQEDMAVARDGVLGFDPLPGAPLWNIRDWVVVE
jgi:ABC-type transport system substrate-binding protein